jgi:hypothetical protein
VKTIGIVEVDAFAIAVVAPIEGDHAHLAAHRVGRQGWHPVVIILGPTVFDDDVLPRSLEVADFVQG